MGRGGLDFEKIGWLTATFKAGDELKSAVEAAKGWENDGRDAVLDKAVYLSGNGEVDFPSSGTESIFGRVEQYEFDEHVTVQVGGFCELPMTETSGDQPSAGDYAVVNSNGEVEDAGTEALDVDGAEATVDVPVYTRGYVVSVNTEDNTCVVFLG